MIDLYLPPKPAILRVGEPWQHRVHEFLARHGVPFSKRLAVVGEIKRLSHTPRLLREAQKDLARFIEVPVQAIGFGLGGNLGGFWAGSSGGGAVALVDNIALGSDSDLTTYPFNNVALTGSWTHLIIEVAARGPTSVSGITVEGFPATPIVSASDGTAVSVAAIYIIQSSTSTPDIEVTFGAGAVNCQTHVYAVSGLQSTTEVHKNSTGTANPSVLDVNTSAGGIVIAGGVCLNASSCAWTGVTETHDTIRESSFDYSGGYALTATAETPRTVRATWSGTANYRITVAASFR